jgi:hypothetical protein
MQEYNMRKVKMKIRLKKDFFRKIYMSFDFWTFPKSIIFMIVIIYYYSRDYQLQIRLLGFRRLYREYSEEN